MPADSPIRQLDEKTALAWAEALCSSWIDPGLRKRVAVGLMRAQADGVTLCIQYMNNVAKLQNTFADPIEVQLRRAADTS
jgi:hypothetical protein